MIEKINGGKEDEYEKDFMKIRFESDDNLHLVKILNLHMLTVIVRSVFEEDGKYYSQVFEFFTSIWMFLWSINARIW